MSHYATEVCKCPNKSRKSTSAIAIQNKLVGWYACGIKGMNITEAIKTIYGSKLYKKLKVENTKMWHLGPVALYQELETELN